MILHGRITVYGEYLMWARARGLVMPSRLYLATGTRIDLPVRDQYDHARDRVARFLESRGFQTERRICGDLPFGFGLSSSTILAFLHTSRTLPLADAIPVVHECDREMHGFEPSGVDAAAISRQVPGVFSAQGWENVQLSQFPYTLVFLPAERARTPVEIKARMCEPAVSMRLTSIANDLTSSVIATGAIDYGLLFDYCRGLVDASVYSNVASSVVATLLARGIAAKAIGGLYDKAILAVWPDVNTAGRSVHLLDGYRFSPALY